MLGALIAELHKPELVDQVLATLEPELAEAVEMRAASASMSTPVFVSGAVRAFLDTADDDLWFQLISLMRKSDDPGLKAVQTILEWVATQRQTS